MKAEDRDALVKIIRQHRRAEVVLPEKYYTPGANTVRTEIDGIKVMLHRWLYEQLTHQNLGDDRLRRHAKHDPRNVNPLLMVRVRRGDPTIAKTCPQGHVYAKVGELPRGRADGRRCQQCWRDARNKINERDRVGGSDVASGNRDKTHCKFGHEYTPENTLSWPGDKGRRRCRQCETNRSKQRWNERKNNAHTQEGRAGGAGHGR